MAGVSVTHHPPASGACGSMGGMADPDLLQTVVRVESTKRVRPVGRGRIAVLLLVVLIIGVTVSVAVPLVRQNRPGAARPLGTWGSYLRLDLPSGWAVTTRTLTPETESVAVESVDGNRPATSPRECRVTVWSVGVVPPTPTLARDAQTVAVRIDGREGRLVTTERTATLHWTYARDAMAETTCDTVAPDPDLLREIAGAWLEIGPAPRTIPFTLDGGTSRAPVVEVQLDERGAGRHPILTSLRMESVAPPGGWSLSLGLVADDVVGVALTRTRTAANGLVVRVAADGTQGCLERAPQVCAQASWNGDALPQRGGAISTALVIGLLGDVRLADRVDDPTTWFELDTALG